MKNNIDKLICVFWEENNLFFFQQYKYMRYLCFVYIYVYRFIYVFINNININIKFYYVLYQYYIVYILFLYDFNELYWGYFFCCYEDVEVFCIWDGDIEILLQRGGVLVGWDLFVVMRIQRFFIYGMGMQRFFIEGQGFGWGGIYLLL